MSTSEPFSGQLHALVAEDPRAESVLWFASVMLGVFGCKTVYNAMKTFSPQYFNAYIKLSKRDKVEWDNRGFSTAHAIIISASAAYFLLFSDLFRDDDTLDAVVLRSSISSELMLGVSVGYFISDLAMILMFYPALGGIEYVFHHLLSIISLCVAMYCGHGHFYTYIILFSEITTPFVNLRWYLSAAGMKNSKAYIINGICLVFGWLIARILLFIYFFCHVYVHYDEVKKIHGPEYYCVLFVPPCLAFMNLYWFYKVAKGLQRTLSKKA